VALSPRSFQANDFARFFFEEIQQVADVVVWGGPWEDLANLDSGPAAATARLASQQGMQSLVQVAPYDGSGKLRRPLDEAGRRAYRDIAVAFVRRHLPAYLVLGVEVNDFATKAPAEFEAFVTLFSETYDAVKAVSPATKVFPTFQLERLRGLGGGLFGGMNDPSMAKWQLIQRFPKADLVGFTTYPSIIFKEPSDVPADYYAEAAARAGKPIAFVESGWFAETPAAGWESSEEEQAAFARRLLEMARPLAPELVTWTFLYDPGAQGGLPTVFLSMGLLRPDGSPRPAWEVWRAAAKGT
jgi:hypothetical protein